MRASGAPLVRGERADTPAVTCPRCDGLGVIAARCEFCDVLGELTCVHRSDGWRCTREKGHAGDHVACIIDSEDMDDHDLARWIPWRTDFDNLPDGARIVLYPNAQNPLHRKPVTAYVHRDGEAPGRVYFFCEGTDPCEGPDYYWGDVLVYNEGFEVKELER